jgi:simple sugar transport system permease protein
MRRPEGARHAWEPLARAALALGAGLAVLALFFQLGGQDPVAALGAMWRGAFGSVYAFTSGTLVRAVPLALIALGFGVAYRAGALNIGAEGQFYAGAMAATWAGLRLAAWPSALAIPATLACALAAGALWIAVPVWLRHRFGVLEAISTLLLNFVAEAAVSWAVQGPLQEATGVYPQSDPLPPSALLPLVPGTRLHLGFVLAIAAAAGLWWLYRRTRLGFELLATGAGPRAAVVSGRIRVGRLAAGALLASGALAGLAGGTEVMGVSRALYPNLSPGYGFTGIAVALLARGHPLGVLASAVLFGALEAGAGAMQREAGVPAVAVYVAEAVIIVAVLLADTWRVRTRARAAA